MDDGVTGELAHARERVGDLERLLRDRDAALSSAGDRLEEARQRCAFAEQAAGELRERLSAVARRAEDADAVITRYTAQLAHAEARWVMRRAPWGAPPARWLVFLRKCFPMGADVAPMRQRCPCQDALVKLRRVSAHAAVWWELCGAALLCLSVWAGPTVCGCRCADLESKVREAQARADSASDQAKTAAAAASHAAEAARDAAHELDRQVRVRSALERELDAQRRLTADVESQVGAGEIIASGPPMHFPVAWGRRGTKTQCEWGCG